MKVKEVIDQNSRSLSPVRFRESPCETLFACGSLLTPKLGNRTFRSTVSHLSDAHQKTSLLLRVLGSRSLYTVSFESCFFCRRHLPIGFIPCARTPQTNNNNNHNCVLLHFRFPFPRNVNPLVIVTPKLNEKKVTEKRNHRNEGGKHVLILHGPVHFPPSPLRLLLRISRTYIEGAAPRHFHSGLPCCCFFTLTSKGHRFWNRRKARTKQKSRGRENTKQTEANPKHSVPLFFFFWRLAARNYLLDLKKIPADCLCGCLVFHFPICHSARLSHLFLRVCQRVRERIVET